MALSGCIEGDRGGATERNASTPTTSGTATPEYTAPETETRSPDGVTPDCWPDMCEGTQIVEVVVRSGFSGAVILDAGCRDTEHSVRAGESVRIERRRVAESCEVSLAVDGSEEYSEDVAGYKRVTVTVDSDGGVETEAIVY